MYDLPKTVISEYNNSAVLMQLIENFNTCVDPSVNLQNFYDQIWNIETAVGVGLDIWGRIVGVNRTLTVTGGEFLGFTSAVAPVQSSGNSFNAAIFYSGTMVTSNFVLTDQSYRQLILAKAAANITNGSVPSINYILMNILFPDRGVCFCQDNQDMSLTYVFHFSLQPFELAIVTTANVLPTPAGVLANVSYPS